MNICVINEVSGIDNVDVKETIDVLLDTDNSSIFNSIKKELLKGGRPEILFCSSLDDYKTSKLNELPKSQKLVLYIVDEEKLEDFTTYLTVTGNADSISVVWGMSLTENGYYGNEYVVESWSKHKPHGDVEKPALMDVIKGMVETVTPTQDTPEVTYDLNMNGKFALRFGVQHQ